ncbi:AAA family ATPase [Fusarium beomiforme]|uniref:AAA family ATPase n=1 Tax=Fusarium beomiforme TaxID=44412 RepID=A0A9P5A7A0_9HYPO|nr:AAA family ATPase [Fusarium beomiforme]
MANSAKNFVPHSSLIDIGPSQRPEPDNVPQAVQSDGPDGRPETAENSAQASISKEQYQTLAEKITQIEHLMKRQPDANESSLFDDYDDVSDLEEVNDAYQEYFTTMRMMQHRMHYSYKRIQDVKAARARKKSNIGNVPTMTQPNKLSDEQEVLSNEAMLSVLTTGAKAELSYVDWEIFRAQNVDIKGGLAPIEILIGEPELDLDWNPLVQLPLERNKKKDTAKNLAKENRITESGPLPERLRIHSKPLIAILSKVHVKDINSDNGKLTLLRPYKILVHYEQKLNDWLKVLERKLARKTKMGNDHRSSEAEGCLREDTPGNLEAKPGLGDSMEGVESDTQDNVRHKVEQNDDNDNDSDDDHDDDDTNSPAALIHLRCLLDFVTVHIHPKVEYIRSGKCENISFNDLWFLFKPGDEVIGSGKPQAYRVIRVTTPPHKVIPPWARWANSKEPEEPFTVHCVYIDSDGTSLGPVSERFYIPRYEGDKPIKVLPICPLRNRDNRRAELIERGRKFVNVAKVKPMYYMGVTLDTREEVDSQVVVDFYEALSDTEKRDWMPSIEPVDTSVESKEEEQPCRALCCHIDTVHDDAHIDGIASEEFHRNYILRTISGDQASLVIYPRAINEIKNGGDLLSDDEHVIMSYRAFGFVLRNRKWAQLDLTDLSYENVKNSESTQKAFENLELPEGHKDMVQALVTQHFREKESISHRDEKSDLIRGKGKGLIILLHGAPGVGKTTTAGDLGTTAHDVQTELEKNFALASRWGCILLLDEADVFLAQRERKDFKRNGLVAVFLRVLEYYTGILFLTTNRVGDFDEAFASRIHMSLFYPELNLEKTENIFRLNLELIENRFQNRESKLIVDKSAILSFAKSHFEEYPYGRWNGRQIRNACQTAFSLAEFETNNKSISLESDRAKDVFLKLGHFKTVQKAYLDFSKYLGDIYGTERDQRASENHFRAKEKTHRGEGKVTQPDQQYHSAQSEWHDNNYHTAASDKGYDRVFHPSYQNVDPRYSRGFRDEERRPQYDQELYQPHSAAPAMTSLSVGRAGYGGISNAQNIVYGSTTSQEAEQHPPTHLMGNHVTHHHNMPEMQSPYTSRYQQDPSAGN